MTDWFLATTRSSLADLLISSCNVSSPLICFNQFVPLPYFNFSNHTWVHGPFFYQKTTTATSLLVTDVGLSWWQLWDIDAQFPILVTGIIILSVTMSPCSCFWCKCSNSISELIYCNNQNYQSELRFKIKIFLMKLN